MRLFHHETDPHGEILISDPNSLKAKFGLCCPEAYEPDDPRFLTEIRVGNRRGYIISPPSAGLQVLGAIIQQGFTVVELQNPGGGYTECQVHESKIE